MLHTHITLDVRVHNATKEESAPTMDRINARVQELPQSFLDECARTFEAVDSGELEEMPDRMLTVFDRIVDHEIEHMGRMSLGESL